MASSAKNWMFSYRAAGIKSQQTMWQCNISPAVILIVAQILFAVLKIYSMFPFSYQTFIGNAHSSSLQGSGCIAQICQVLSAMQQFVALKGDSTCSHRKIIISYSVPFSNDGLAHPSRPQTPWATVLPFPGSTASTSLVCLRFGFPLVSPFLNQLIYHSLYSCTDI